MDVVGNVSAAKLGDKEIELGKITATATGDVYAEETYEPEVKGSKGNVDTTITIDTATLKFLDEDAQEWLNKEAAWVGFHIELPTVSGDDNVTYRLTFTRPDGTSKEFFDGSHSDWTSGEPWDIVAPITMDDLHKAALGDGTITMKYILTWSIIEKDESSKAVKNTAEVTQNVTFKINANKIVVVDERDDAEEDATLWNADKATIYKMTNPVPAIPTEEDKTTEENKKDDVPKTGEVI